MSYEEGLTRQITDSSGNTITYELQAKHGIGRIHSSSDSCGSCPGSSGTTYELNDRLRINSSTDSLGNITLYTYDNQSNIVTKTEASQTPQERTTVYTWHPVLNLVTSVMRESISIPGQTDITNFEYDTHSRLKKILNPDGGVEEMGYDDNNNLIRKVAADGNIVSYQYDPLNRVTRVTQLWQGC
ncbi:MAG: RHS repeat protein [Desulfamplus sp.]|nr:RHS repeat protein [Desulfamplus sp.]